MSDDNNKFGFGPKKPRATFGDAMLGIPSGGGERDRPKRDSRGPGRDRPREDAQAPAPSAEEPKRDARPPKKRESKAPKGPMVVVKRASGVVEERGQLGEKPADAVSHAGTVSSPVEPAEASSPAEAGPSQAEPVAPVARTVQPSAPAPSSALYEEVSEDQSFAEMFAASKQDTGSRRGVRPGEKVSGPIFQLGADTAFISLGGKSEAMIELRELKDDEGILRFGVGDVIEAYVLEAGARGILLTKSINKGSASLAMLAEARVTGMPVEGLVLSVNKGGLEVAVGETRAFCPVSQIDVRFVEKPDQFVGERLKFRVTEVRERNVVLSRRALLEEEQKAQAAETRKTLEAGKVVKGKVVGVRDFGAFVDLGGIEGMIPVSELSHVHVGHPSDVVKVGDDVEVEVLRMEPGNPNSADKAKQKERITLSLRARQEDPWKAALAEIQEGSRLTGKVVRLQPFGAFVELRPGVDGLIHISALSNKRIAHPRDVVNVGDEVLVEVDKVDPAEKRIGLRRISEEEAAEPAQPREQKPREATERVARARVGQIVTGKVERVEPYGVFLGFPGGRGLIPASETGTERGTDLRKHFPLEKELKAEVLEIDASGKIRLSMTAALRSEERADVEAFRQSQKPQQGAGKKGFGTFADLLKGLK